MWREISALQISGNEISGIQSFQPAFLRNSDKELSKLRIRIGRPPWIWNDPEPAANSDGFLAEAGYQKNDLGIAGEMGDLGIAGEMGDLGSENFISAPFTIPAGLTLSDLKARVWFENMYSVSDDENTGEVSPQGASTKLVNFL